MTQESPTAPPQPTKTVTLERLVEVFELWQRDTAGIATDAKTIIDVWQGKDYPRHCAHYLWEKM
jgi:hypothetical protein